MYQTLYFVIPMALSAILILPVKAIGIKLGLYAKENNRTIHHGKIVRVGGVAIYLAVIICSFTMLEDVKSFFGILLGATIIFIEGLLDDAFDISPKLKLFGQFLAAFVVLYFGGVGLTIIRLPFNLIISNKVLCYAISFVWIVGITNAINLIDGLDGLAAGFSIIVLMTICLLSTVINKTAGLPLCLILVGSTMGFLFYNFHPASIFMGDCGAQLLGFMISAISLLGFKSTTFITLAIPITLLFVPIFDTFIAIIRRKLNGQKISAPDKGHLHHILMKNLRLGQTGAVFVIYFVTALFGLTSYLYVKNKEIGIIMLCILILMFDIFIEYTGMISKSYRPILGLLDKFKTMFEDDKEKKDIQNNE